MKPNLLSSNSTDRAGQLSLLPTGNRVLSEGDGIQHKQSDDPILYRSEPISSRNYRLQDGYGMMCNTHLWMSHPKLSRSRSSVKFRKSAREQTTEEIFSYNEIGRLKIKKY
jgi:hypothetical protein